MKVSLLPLCLLSAVAAGQSSVPSDSPVQAIVGARIEVGDGRVIPVGNVIIRDGLISAVGEGAAIPAGAEIMDGKGLTVYPGFIDAYTTKGLNLPPAQPDADDVPDFSTSAPAMMREANRKGISPELHASRYLALTEDVRKSYWNAGFTTAMIVPGAGNLAGYGTLVNLGGRPNRNSVLLADTGMDCGLNRGVGFPPPGQAVYYPGTILGYIAQTRQTLLDAQWYAKLNDAYKAGGPLRPPLDPSLDALQPVLSGSIPVFFDADSRRWMERSLMIADEFHLKPIMAGAKEAWKLTDRIKAESIPLIVSVSFGKEPDPEKPAPKPPVTPTPPAKPAEATGPDTSNKKTEDDPEPTEQLGERQRLFREQLGNVLSLAKAGIPFSLTTKGTKDMDEFMSNLRRAVKEGLSRDVVLRGLTSEPAHLFGVDRLLGSVQVGKIANVVVMSGDFLSDGVKTKMIYIDGRKIDPSRGPAATAPKIFGGHEN